MKKCFFLILAVILATHSATSVDAAGPTDPVPVQVGEKFGYRTVEGKDLAGGLFDQACTFRDGLAAVRKDKAWGFIDTEGRTVLPLEYEGVAPLQAQSRRVPEEEQCGYFLGNLAAVKKHGKWGMIDRTGKYVVNPEFVGVTFGAYVLTPDNSLRPSRGNGSWFFSGVEKYIMRIETVGGEQWDLVRQSDVIVSMEDNVLVRVYRNPKPERVVTIRTSAAGWRRIKVMEKWGFEDAQGILVVPAIYRDAGDYSEELARVNDGGKWGFLDNTAKMAIAPRFEAAGDFSEGRAPVRVAGKWGYIDPTGALVIPPTFQFAYPFRDGKARVLLWNGTFRHVDRDGATVP